MSFHRACSDAPNPCMKVSDLGFIGLPLNPREAQLIKLRAEQAPFGKGERTVVDTSIRDTWQLDADKVRILVIFVMVLYQFTQVVFHNRAWSLWLERVVQEVCTALGVNFAASQPRCELYKLLIYETGSQYVFILSLL